MIFPILSMLIFLPLIGALVLIFARRDDLPFNRNVTLGVMVVILALAMGLFVAFPSVSGGANGMKFEENSPWIHIQQLGLQINYHLGADGISLLMILLTALISPIAFYASWNSIADRFRLFSIMFLLVETGVLGMFVAQDLILFYVFWEAMLIPMYFLIGMWGTPNKGSFAAIKFFLYTMAGSVLMLVAIIATYMLSTGTNPTELTTRTFDLTGMLQNLQTHPIAGNIQLWLFLGFAIAFAIKIPIFPFHSWLPEAYVEAPLGATIMMAAVFSKAGAYGLLRFGLPLFPAVVQELAPWFLTMGVVGVIYGALIAAVQQDMKRLIAFSSISHLGLIVLGIFSMSLGNKDLVAASTNSLTGASLHLLNHGVIIAALFLIVAFLEQRFGTRTLKDYLGLMRAMPVLAGFFLVIMLAAVALPGTNGFVGEFLILLGVFQTYPVFAVLGTSVAVLTAIYMLWMYQKTMHESPVKPHADVAHHDLKRHEMALLAPAIVLIFWIGLYPNPFLERLKDAVAWVLGGIK
ncbi:NADH-quinone oxidoreductase subunit M [Candidatus Acetothermia bacterium]|nr:NADH-quinone oxidoreductase subunit M [Candidatus Acetothermia bacterium]